MLEMSDLGAESRAALAITAVPERLDVFLLHQGAMHRELADKSPSNYVACDRGSPCSNCVSARLDCTHSAVATKAIGTKQRVLISTEYERKIDDIAESITGIKLALQKLGKPVDSTQTVTSDLSTLEQVVPARPLITNGFGASQRRKAQWDHPVEISRFIKTIVQDRVLNSPSFEENDVFISLRNLVQALEDSGSVRNSSFPNIDTQTSENVALMPPMEAAISVLRWTEDHQTNYRIEQIARILPLSRLAEICRAVYFVINDYNDVEFILANGYLSYAFSVYITVTGEQHYQDYYLRCQQNLQNALMRLPLVLPASMEAVAALTIGAIHAVESSRATLAWAFTSAAANLCKILGYHISSSAEEADKPAQAAKANLFWTLYNIDKGMSLRLGRSSSLRDNDITLACDSFESRYARIQGKVYDLLYSPVALSQPITERACVAGGLAKELRELMNRSHSHGDTLRRDEDILQTIYLKCETVCRLSILVYILRAVPPPPGSPSSVTDECLMAALSALDTHEQCIIALRSYEHDPSMVMRYINWAVLHTPFIPFSVVFTHIVQRFDTSQLSRLESFTASLKQDESSPESITHPYRLYKLLCDATRLYLNANNSHLSAREPALQPPPFLTGEPDFMFGMDASDASVGVIPEEYDVHELIDWYTGNQQLMSLLDEDMIF